MIRPSCSGLVLARGSSDPHPSYHRTKLRRAYLAHVGPRRAAFDRTGAKPIRQRLVRSATGEARWRRGGSAADPVNRAGDRAGNRPWTGSVRAPTGAAPGCVGGDHAADRTTARAAAATASTVAADAGN